MHKIRTVIIDDEELARRVIAKHLERFPDIEVIAECCDGFEGIKTIRDLRPDLIFLDIQMPRLNGFEMLELLDNPPVTIFVTAYDQYAFQAFEASAVDYLLKPFNAGRFDSSLERARKFLKSPRAQQAAIDNIRKNPGRGKTLQRVVVNHKDGVVVVPVNEIIRLEAQGDYVMLYTAKTRYLKHQTMTFFEQHLPTADFIRLHRSHLVSLSAINRIEPAGKGSYQANLQDGTIISVSRSGYQRFRSAVKT